MHFAHEQLIGEALAELESDPDVVGVMVQGSVARGDAYSTSDLDLFVLLRDGCPHSFMSTVLQNILVERHASSKKDAITKIRANAMLAYGFTDGKILRDDSGALADLVQTARDVIYSYTISPRERMGIFYWLQSAQVKITAARDAGDTLKASFIVATTSWKILEGMWAVNHLPMPPSGAVLAHRHDLTNVPPDWEERFDNMFQGEEPNRVQAAITLMEWLQQFQ